MGTTEHTPGPWKAEANEKASSIAILGKHGDAGRVRSSDGYGYITFVDCADAMSDDTMFSPMLDEQVANARLIAAAPDMLEALKDAAAILRKEGVPGWGVAKDIINSAISKAEGRS